MKNFIKPKFDSINNLNNLIPYIIKYYIFVGRIINDKNEFGLWAKTEGCHMQAPYGSNIKSLLNFYIQ